MSLQVTRNYKVLYSMFGSNSPLQRGAILLHVHVLYSVMYLGTFGIIESVQGANKITGNTSNSLELNALANDAVFICMKSCVHNDISIYSCK